jgi:hypothetical protein
VTYAPAPPPRTPPAPRSPRESAGYIPWWLLGMVAAACLMGSLGLAAAVLLTRPGELPQATATAVVLTAPPVTGGPAETPTVQSPPTQPGEGPTDTPPPPPPGVVGIGAYVQVVGTGDAGFLNLRSEPSLESVVNYLAIENEVFQVQAGPTDAEGFVWWYLVDPATGSRFGWAVQNYLQVVQGPGG